MRVVQPIVPLVTLGLLLAMAPLRTSAQVSTLRTGAHVRITASTLAPDRQTGIVLAQRPDTLVMRLDGRADSVAIPVGTIRALELDGGRHSRVLKGMGVGFLAGAVVGGLTGALSYTPSQCGACFFQPTRAGSAALGAIGGALVGPVIGAAVGAIWRVQEWHPMALAGSSLSVRVAALAARGVGAAASIAF